MDLKITGAKLSGDAEKDVKTLSNYVFQLEEQLRYQLRNLDVTNFNDLGLARYENGRMQLYAKQVEIQTEKLRVEFGKETDDIYAEISATAEELLAEIESVDGSYSKLSQTVSGVQTTVSSQAKTISSHTSSINSLQSQITQTANEIAAVVSAVDDDSGNVTAASIVAAINKAGSSIKISADHIELESDLVTISDLSGTGKVEINAGNIKTGGTISGCRLETSEGASGNIVIDQTYITMGDNYVILSLGSGGLFGIFNERGGLELAYRDRFRIYDNDYGNYWQLYPWGWGCHDARNGTLIRQIVAEDA